MARRLTRSQDGRPAAPVRHVHLGLGNFFRAHVAWYTEHASDAADWGIVAFTGRSPGVAPEMEAQDGLYTLVVQGADGNDYQVISSVVTTHSGGDVPTLLEYFAAPATAVVTSSITEAGYCRGADGGLDEASEAVQADVAALREDRLADVRTAPGKFVAGLLVRRAADAGPITFCPCDNLPENGEMVARVIGDLAALAAPDLTPWIARNVGFVTTMVDRITPRPTPALHDAVLEDTGVDDPACVGTEPFAQWVLSGEFRAGRPAWETSGAQFVPDITPYETLKLRLLNGAHTLLAYVGPLRGHETVRDAMADPEVAGWVEQWWDLASEQLAVPADEVTAYRAALAERFANPAIRHLLAQIAADGSQKLGLRIVPALRAALDAGEDATGAERAVAAWALHLRGRGTAVNDVSAGLVTSFAKGELVDTVTAVCHYLGIQDPASLARIDGLAAEMAG